MITHYTLFLDLEKEEVEFQVRDAVDLGKMSLNYRLHLKKHLLEKPLFGTLAALFNADFEELGRNLAALLPQNPPSAAKVAHILQRAHPLLQDEQLQTAVLEQLQHALACDTAPKDAQPLLEEVFDDFWQMMAFCCPQDADEPTPTPSAFLEFALAFCNASPKLRRFCIEKKEPPTEKIDIRNLSCVDFCATALFYALCAGKIPQYTEGVFGFL